MDPSVFTFRCSIQKSCAKNAKKGQISLLIYLIVIVKMKNQRQFDEIYEYCQLIFDKKLELLTKFNLYYQTKDVLKEYHKLFINISRL